MSSNRPRIVASRRRSGLVAVGLGASLALATGLAGCVESLPYAQLPELAKDPRPVLTPEQQKAAATELDAQRAARRDAALKEIEQKR